MARRTRPPPPALGARAHPNVLELLAQVGPADEPVLRAPGAPPLRRGELLRRARAVAQGLRRLGVDAEEEVLMALPAGIIAAEAVFGALGAGAICRLVDPLDPVDLADGLRFHDGDLALTVAAVPGPRRDTAVLPLLRAAELRAGRAWPRLIVRAARGAAAPLTAPRQLDWGRALGGGSPARPGGALGARARPRSEGLVCWDPVVPGVRRLVDQAILDGQVAWMRALIPEPAERLWVSAGMGAPFGLTGGLLAPLLAGHGLVLDPAALGAPARAWATLSRERVDVVLTTREGVRALRRASAGRRPPPLPALRQICCVAGRPDPAHLRWMMRSFPGVELTLG